MAVVEVRTDKVPVKIRTKAAKVVIVLRVERAF